MPRTERNIVLHTFRVYPLRTYGVIQAYENLGKPTCKTLVSTVGRIRTYVSKVLQRTPCPNHSATTVNNRSGGKEKHCSCGIDIGTLFRVSSVAKMFFLTFLTVCLLCHSRNFSSHHNKNLRLHLLTTKNRIPISYTIALTLKCLFILSLTTYT